jgi:uncharacterized membrane protein YkvA (DUF1232 family)
MKFLKDLIFDPRIPSRDRKVLALLAFFIISPIDFIPDWILFFGQLDDLILMGIIVDYFFHYLDQDIFLTHWPAGMKTYVWLKRLSSPLAILAPRRLRKMIFKYRPRPY